MGKINIRKMPEDLTIRVLKAWTELEDKYEQNKLLKSQYRTWFERNIKYYTDTFKRYKTKKAVYRLYNLRGYEKKQVNDLTYFYPEENELYWQYAQ